MNQRHCARGFRDVLIGTSLVLPLLISPAAQARVTQIVIDFVPACDGASVGVPGPCQISFTTSTIINPFVFDWSYSSADSAGANDDLFGMLIDGVRVQLSDPGGAIFQTGHVSIAANTTFGWYVNCTDCTYCIEGAATAVITNFAAPEPETMALMGFGVAAAAFARRTRSARPAMAVARPAC